MAINFPTLAQVIGKAKTGIKNALINSNPFLRNSFLEAFAKMCGGRVYDFYYNLEKNVIPNLFLTTATDSDSIETLVQPFSIIRNPATKSSGVLIGSGILTTAIPAGTTFQDSQGNSYISTLSITVNNVNLLISNLTQVGGLATATITDHGFFSGLSITISGANETDFNGAFSITVLDKDTFNYSINPAAPAIATGVITASTNKADVLVISQNFGEETNLSGGEELTITTPIAGFNDEVYVQYPSLAGGSDIESNDSLKNRGLDRYINPSGNFTKGDIVRAVKLDRDNTRVWAQPITPDIGQVTVYFVRDNDGIGADILPGAPQIQTARDNIIAISPAPFDFVNDLFVVAPTPVVVNFNFSSITPYWK